MVKRWAWCFYGALLFVSSAQAKIFQFVYIEASEGNASGGHVAIQLASDIYHYQYENERIRLFKQTAEDFRMHYQLLQNRSLHRADIAVSETTFKQLTTYFKQQFFNQRQYLKSLQAMQQNEALLHALLSTKTHRIYRSETTPNLNQHLSGAGLFYDNSISMPAQGAGCHTTTASISVLKQLKAQLSAQYGDRFIVQKIANLTQTLQQLTPTTKNQSLTTAYAFSEAYHDLLNGLLALQVIQQYRPLSADACFQIKQPQLRLQNEDVNQARELQQTLLQSAQALVVSKRPDWGYALFVTLARLIALEQSMQTRYWTFIDDTDTTISPLPKSKLTLYAKPLQQHRNQDLNHLHETVANFGTDTSAYEHNYLALEMAANRYQQWLLSDTTGALRYHSEQPLPNKSLSSLRFLMTTVPVELLSTALQQQKQLNTDLDEQDLVRNSYHLVSNNCVTLLLESIDKALAQQSKQALGGFIAPKVHFIPFEAYQAVQKTYRVVKTQTEPAYRQQALSKLYERDVNGWVYVREANIFSSSLYRYNSDDAWFVFFTDDALLLRPLFGAVNTLAATGQSIWGLLHWPFDDGKGIKTGVKGIMASLPELAFFNIRKGSYPYPIELPY